MTSRDEAIAAGAQPLAQRDGFREEYGRRLSVRMLDAAHQAGHTHYTDECPRAVSLASANRERQDAEGRRVAAERSLDGLRAVARGVVKAAKLGHPIRDLGESINRLSELLDQHDDKGVAG